MIYRIFRRIRKGMYHVFIEPDIKRSLASCGKDTHIEQNGDFYPLSHISIGNCVSVGQDARFWTTRANIYIGDYVIFGPGVTIITGDHRKDVVGRHISELTDSDKLSEDDQDVAIEKGAWIGANVTILKGVRIGEDSVIAAGSVVTKDIPPYIIAGGVPAKKICDRFSEEDLKTHISEIKKREKMNDTGHIAEGDVQVER